MNPTDSLPLRDIHLPDPVSWWPPAMGWWFLLILIVLLIWLVVVVIKRLRKPVLKKSASAELDLLITDYKHHQDKHFLLQQLSILLRRIGISYLNRNETAGIAGAKWYQMINQLVEKNRISDDMIELLSQGPYQQKPQLDEQKINILIEQMRLWVAALSREKANV